MPTSLATWAGRLFLFVSIPLSIVVFATLMAGHWVPLPMPAVAEERLEAALGALELGEFEDGEFEDGAAQPDDVAASIGERGWSLHHVLYADCRCSRRVVAHLLASQRPQDVREVALVVGDAPDLAAACREAGFEVVALTQVELEERLGVVAAPLLVIADAAGRSRYVGGYTDRKQGLVLRDLEFLGRLRAGERVESLPVYGCGVSRSLQDALDPLGLKY